MGLTGSGLNRFRARIDATLQDAFPVTLVLPGAIQVEASGVGGKRMTEFVNGGESKSFSFPFRVPVTEGWTPAVGQSVDWVISEAVTLTMEITNYSLRPHEAVHAITCRYRKP